MWVIANGLSTKYDEQHRRTKMVFLVPMHAVVSLSLHMVRQVCNICVESQACTIAARLGTWQFLKLGGPASQLAPFSQPAAGNWIIALPDPTPRGPASQSMD